MSQMPQLMHFLNIMLCFLQCCLLLIKEKLHLESLIVTSVQDSDTVSKSEEKSNTYIFTKYINFNMQVFLFSIFPVFHSVLSTWQWGKKMT